MVQSFNSFYKCGFYAKATGLSVIEELTPRDRIKYALALAMTYKLVEAEELLAELLDNAEDTEYITAAQAVSAATAILRGDRSSIAKRMQLLDVPVSVVNGSTESMCSQLADYFEAAGYPDYEALYLQCHMEVTDKKDCRAIGDAKCRLASNLFNQGNFPKAAELYRSAASEYAKDLGNSNPLVLLTMLNSYSACYEALQFHTAYSGLKHLVAQPFPDDYIEEVAMLRLQLVNCSLNVDKVDEAEQILAAPPWRLRSSVSRETIDEWNLFKAVCSGLSGEITETRVHLDLPAPPPREDMSINEIRRFIGEAEVLRIEGDCFAAYEKYSQLLAIESKTQLRLPRPVKFGYIACCTQAKKYDEAILALRSAFSSINEELGAVHVIAANLNLLGIDLAVNSQNHELFRFCSTYLREICQIYQSDVLSNELEERNVLISLARKRSRPFMCLTW